MLEKYRLLDYVQHNCTKNATALTPLASNWDKLQDIIFKRDFMFDMRPWDIDMYKPEATVSHLPYLLMFRWAIDEGLLMYVTLLGSPPSGSSVWEYCLYEGVSGIDPLIRASKSDHVEVFAYFLSLLQEKVYYYCPEEKREVILEMAKHASPAMLEQIRLWIDKSIRKEYMFQYLSKQFWNVCKAGNTHAAALIHWVPTSTSVSRTPPRD